MVNAARHRGAYEKSLRGRIWKTRRPIILVDSSAGPTLIVQRSNQVAEDLGFRAGRNSDAETARPGFPDEIVRFKSCSRNQQADRAAERFPDRTVEAELPPCRRIHSVGGDNEISHDRPSTDADRAFRIGLFDGAARKHTRTEFHGAVA